MGKALPQEPHTHKSKSGFDWSEVVSVFPDQTLEKSILNTRFILHAVHLQTETGTEISPKFGRKSRM